MAARPFNARPACLCSLKPISSGTIAGVLSSNPEAAPARSWTVLEVLRWTTQRFTERGLDSPRLDAELLAAHAFGMTRLRLYAEFDRPLLAEELTALRDLVKRRQAGEPVAYLTGHKEFWSLDLAVDARVLIPRPDTETLVEVALDVLAIDVDAQVADIGTGSGAVALAIAKQRPRAQVTATDLSDDALNVARANATQLGLNVTFRSGNLLASIPSDARFHLIVANLPYIPSADIPGLAPEVRSEPMRALDGGADGLDLVRRLITSAPAHLHEGGVLALEIGAGQADATVALMAVGGFAAPERRSDLGGIERVIWARIGGNT